MPRKNNPFRALFPLLLIFVLVDSKNDCLTRFCGKNKSFPIYYPFRLEGDNKLQKGCDQNLAVNLKCSNQENIPSFGDFYVRNINYSSQIIQLYDPNNCLPSLLMNSNFSISPLMAISYQNYTFYNCPLTSTTRSNFTAITCLSNATFSTLATSSISRAQELNTLGCNMIRTVQIPVSSPLQYEYNGFNEDLMLTWNVSNCEVCKNPVKSKRNSAGHIVWVLFAVLILPNLVGLFLYLLWLALVELFKIIAKFARVIKMKLTRTRDRSTHPGQPASIPSQISLPVVPAQPHRVDIGSVMNTIVLGESRRVPGPNSNTCPICLEDYNPRDRIKCSSKCEHYFHASCIDLWLRTHNSCPVCRTATP